MALELQLIKHHSGILIPATPETSDILQSKTRFGDVPPWSRLRPVCAWCAVRSVHSCRRLASSSSGAANGDTCWGSPSVTSWLNTGSGVSWCSGNRAASNTHGRSQFLTISASSCVAAELMASLVLNNSSGKPALFWICGQSGFWLGSRSRVFDVRWQRT